MDLISRQAAIDAVESALIGNHGITEQTITENVVNDVCTKIYKLPSAEPQIIACGEGELYVPDTNVGELISRQAAIDALDVLCQEHRYKIPSKRETYSQYNEAWQDALDRAGGAIFNLPSAQPQPEIVRCKDCKHNPKDTWFECPMSHLSEKQRPETAWCWKGERRTDA